MKKSWQARRKELASELVELMRRQLDMKNLMAWQRVFAVNDG